MPERERATCIAILGFTLLALCQGIADTPGLLRLAAKQVQLKEFLAAQQSLRIVLAKDPNSAEAYNLLGISEMSLGDYVNALNAFQRSINLDSHLPATHVNLGTLMLHMHEERAALKEFESALALDANALTHDSGSYQGFNLFGLCLMNEHKYEAARLAFTHSLRINAGYAPAYANLGMVLMTLNRDSDALQAFFSALKLRPRDPVVVSNIGLIYARQRKFSEATVYLRQAHALNPNDPNVTAGLAAAEIERGRADEAESLIDGLSRTAHLTSSMRASLAASWLQKDQPEKAVRLVEGNAQLSVAFYRLGCEKANALLQETQALAAIRLLKAIRELRTPGSDYYSLLGSAYYTLDRPKEASYRIAPRKM
jgi:Flp pilus assembly protein TadD